MAPSTSGMCVTAGIALFVLAGYQTLRCNSYTTTHSMGWNLRDVDTKHSMHSERLQFVFKAH